MYINLCVYTHVKTTFLAVKVCTYVYEILLYSDIQNKKFKYKYLAAQVCIVLDIDKVLKNVERIYADAQRSSLAATMYLALGNGVDHDRTHLSLRQ